MNSDTKYRLKVATAAAILVLVTDISLLALMQNSYISQTIFNVVALACNFAVFLVVIVLVNRREYKKTVVTRRQ